MQIYLPKLAVGHIICYDGSHVNKVFTDPPEELNYDLCEGANEVPAHVCDLDTSVTTNMVEKHFFLHFWDVLVIQKFNFFLFLNLKNTGASSRMPCNRSGKLGVRSIH